MIITVHVDPCPTCQGEGYASNEMVMGVECPDCPIVPGYQVPEWVKVPMCNDCMFPHPLHDWQPGATIALSTDSGDPTEPPEKVGSAVCTDLVPVIAWNNQRAIATRISDRRVRLLVLPCAVRNLQATAQALDHFVATGWMPDNTWAVMYQRGPDVGRKMTPFDVVCAPGDTLARLEPTP